MTEKLLTPFLARWLRSHMSQVAWVASSRRHCHIDIITHAKYVELYVYILSDIDLGII